jgi:hypothetical protein
MAGDGILTGGGGRGRKQMHLVDCWGPFQNIDSEGFLLHALGELQTVWRMIQFACYTTAVRAGTDPPLHQVVPRTLQEKTTSDRNDFPEPSTRVGGPDSRRNGPCLVDRPTVRGNNLGPSLFSPGTTSDPIGSTQDPTRKTSFDRDHSPSPPLGLMSLTSRRNVHRRGR